MSATDETQVLPQADAPTEVLPTVAPYIEDLERQAQRTINRYELVNLLNNRDDTLAELIEHRAKQRELRRTLKDHQRQVDMAELDALAEMRAQEDFIPGRNAEDRATQAKEYLRHHQSVRLALAMVRETEKEIGRLEDEETRLAMRVEGLRLVYDARLAELNYLRAVLDAGGIRPDWR